MSRGVIVVRDDGGIVESIKSGMDTMDDAFMAAVSNLMVGSKATADTFGNSPLQVPFYQIAPSYFLLLAPLKEEFFFTGYCTEHRKYRTD